MTSVQHHFDQLASVYDERKNYYSFYYDSLKKLLATLIPPDQTILEIGCGTGELLASLKPQKGYGIDISFQMIELSRQKYRRQKNLHFYSSYKKIPHVNFDYIFMSDVIEHLSDPLKTFNWISRRMSQETRFVCTMANPIWEPILLLAERLNLKMPEGDHYRWKLSQLENFLSETKISIIKHDYCLLLPIKIPLLTQYANQQLEPYLKRLAFIEYLVGKKVTRL